MRNKIIPPFFLVCFYFTVSVAFADPVFSGPIRMRGEIEEKNFQSSLFSIEAIDGEFVIVNSQKNRKFHFKTDAKLLEDAVLSKNQNAVAMAFRISNKLGVRRTQKISPVAKL